jgi:hypothetical protein
LECGGGSGSGFRNKKVRGLGIFKLICHSFNSLFKC